jgi:hypothetical protein
MNQVYAQMSKPNSPYALLDYCARKLGADNMFQQPVGGLIELNVTRQQAWDRLMEAVALFNQSHYYGYKPTGLILDLLPKQNRYVLPNNISDVLYYIKYDDTSTMFSLDYQMKQQIGMRMSQFDLVTVELTFEYLKLLDMMIGKKTNFTFNGLTHELNMLVTPQTNEKLILVCYEIINVEEYADIWNDVWLKDMVFNLLKQQWAQNLSKFGNVNLPGGITLNYETMLQESTQRIQELKEELQTTYSYPCSFFVG